MRRRPARLIPSYLVLTGGSLFETFEHGMLTATGEVHRRRRSPFSRTFASRMIAELRPVIRQSANDLISGWYGDGTVEFIEKFAALVPARAISDLLGLPRADIPAFTKLVCSLTPSL